MLQMNLEQELWSRGHSASADRLSVQKHLATGLGKPRNKTSTTTYLQKGAKRSAAPKVLGVICASPLRSNRRLYYSEMRTNCSDNHWWKHQRDPPSAKVQKAKSLRSKIDIGAAKHGTGKLVASLSFGLAKNLAALRAHLCSLSPLCCLH